jgi:hypothetical protein
MDRAANISPDNTPSEDGSPIQEDGLARPRLPEPVVSQTDRVRIATEAINAMSTLLSDLHPRVMTNSSPPTTNSSPEQIRTAGQEVQKSLHTLETLIPEDALQQEQREMFRSIHEGLTSVSDFSRRVSRGDAYEVEHSGLTVSFMLRSIQDIAASFFERYPALQHLAEQIPPREPEPLPLPPEPVEEEFQPPEKKVTTRELPKQSTRERAYKLISGLAEEHVLSPWERFCEKHKKIVGVVAGGTLIGGTAYGMYHAPLLTIGALAVSAAVVAAYQMGKRIPGVSGWIKERGKKYREHQLAKRREKLGAEGTATPDLSMPERRSVNLGSHQPKQNVIDAGELTSSAAKAAKELENCNISDATYEFDRQMGVNGIYVTAGQSGEVQRFDTFCREYDKEHPEEASLLDTWYRSPAVRDNGPIPFLQSVQFTQSHFMMRRIPVLTLKVMFQFERGASAHSPLLFPVALRGYRTRLFPALIMLLKKISFVCKKPFHTTPFLSPNRNSS